MAGSAPTMLELSFPRVLAGAGYVLTFIHVCQFCYYSVCLSTCLSTRLSISTSVSPSLSLSLSLSLSVSSPLPPSLSLPRVPHPALHAHTQHWGRCSRRS